MGSEMCIRDRGRTLSTSIDQREPGPSTGSTVSSNGTIHDQVAPLAKRASFETVRPADANTLRNAAQMGYNGFSRLMSSDEDGANRITMDFFRMGPDPEHENWQRDWIRSRDIDEGWRVRTANSPDGRIASLATAAQLYRTWWVMKNAQPMSHSLLTLARNTKLGGHLDPTFAWSMCSRSRTWHQLSATSGSR